MCMGDLPHCRQSIDTVSFFTPILRIFYDIFMTVRDAPAIFLPAAGVVATGGVSGRDRPLLRRCGQEGNATQIMLACDWLLHNMLNINGVYVRHLGQSIICIALPYREKPSNA